MKTKRRGQPAEPSDGSQHEQVSLPGMNECDPHPLDAVSWIGNPERYQPGEPFCARIEHEKDAAVLPAIGDVVLVRGYWGAEFIVRIHAIRARGADCTYALTEDPPWVAETFRERRAKSERQAEESARRTIVLKDMGLCVCCGEADLENCACHRALAEELANKERQRADETAEQERIRAVEEHNRLAEERRAKLTEEAVEDALVQAGGRPVEAGRLLGVEQFRITASKMQYPDAPNTRYLPQWIGKHAPHLSGFARDLREAART